MSMFPSDSQHAISIHSLIVCFVFICTNQVLVCPNVPLSLFQQCASLEAQCRRTCHVNPVVGFPPFDEQISTGQSHPRAQCMSAVLLAHRPRDLSGTNGRHHEGASTGAAREGRSCATFPHLHFEVRRTEDLYEFHIGLGGKGRAAFQRGTVRFKINVLLQILHKNNGVRVAHGYSADLPLLSIAFQGLFHRAVRIGIGFQCGGYGRSIEDGFSHVDRDCAVVVHYRDYGTREGVDTVR
mmetsp:Transcript_21310/g.62025  ORF Transcript_21310/g.62025 Transcript_21310/m.62025 type:complete len:239 (-) Transcript_21310:609-1325(-)